MIRATSDLHLSEATAPYVFAALDELREDARRHGGWTVLAGDIFDQATSVHVPTWQRLRRLLASWPGERIYVIAGNHDQYDGLYGTVLGGLESGKCRVVTVPLATPIGKMIPYCDPCAYRDYVEMCVLPLEYRKIPLLWTHQGFRGAYRNRMLRDRDGVKPEDVDSSVITITGHYHMPQATGRVIYCGSPFEQTFAEEGQRKGWLRWSDAEKEPYPKRFAFENVGAPRHFTVEWSGEGEPEPPADARPGDRVRLRTTLTREQVQDRSAELVRAGLSAVPVLTRRTEAAMLTEINDPRVAALDYLRRVHGDRVDPSFAADWADENGLWEDSCPK